MSKDSANDSEALTWLASTQNPFVLASNRFEPIEAVIKCVLEMCSRAL